MYVRIYIYIYLYIYVFIYLFILAKRGPQRRVPRGAKRRVSIRCRAEHAQRAKARAGGCESRSGFYIYMLICAQHLTMALT